MLLTVPIAIFFFTVFLKNSMMKNLYNTESIFGLWFQNVRVHKGRDEAAGGYCGWSKNVDSLHI